MLSLGVYMTLNRFYKSLEEIINHLKKVYSEVSEEAISELVRLISEHKRVFVYGAGRSGFVGRCFAQRLMHLGIESYFIGDTTVPSMKPGDIFVVISGSGETVTPVSLARKAKKVGGRIVAVTAHPESTLGKIADLVVKVPGKTKLVEKESYAPFTSLFDVAVLSVLDSVASELMGVLGVTEKDILERHANVE